MFSVDDTQQPTIEVRPATPAAGQHRHQIPPLKTYEKALGAIGALLAAGVSVLGLLSSFTTLDHKAGNAPGGWGWEWPWLLPVGMDLAIPAFTIVGIFLIRLNMRLAWVFLVPRALTAATVYLNWTAARTLPGQVGHAVLTLLWVIFSEIAGHIYTVSIGEASGERMEKIRRIRWVLAPISTAVMWRYMRLWEAKGYQAVVDQRRDAVVFRARMRGEHGWFWRLKTELANERLALKLSRVGVPIDYTLDAPRREEDEQRRREQQRLEEQRRTEQEKRDAEIEARRRAREEAEENERREAERRRRTEEEARQRQIAEAETRAKLARIQMGMKAEEQKRLDEEAAAEARRLAEKAAAAREVYENERLAHLEAEKRRQAAEATARAAKEAADAERRLAEARTAAASARAANASATGSSTGSRAGSPAPASQPVSASADAGTTASPAATGKPSTPTSAAATGSTTADIAEVVAAYQRLRNRLGKHPSDRELGDELGVSRSRAQQLRTAAIAAGHGELAKPFRAAS